MTFKHEHIADFRTVFMRSQSFIISFEGCEGVELLNDIANPNIFFTYSKWHNAEALEKYRQSELFNKVWNEVKKWFADKPEAWSVERV